MALATGAIAACIASCPAAATASLAEVDIAAIGTTTGSVAAIGMIGKALIWIKDLVVEVYTRKQFKINIIIGAFQNGKVSKHFLMQTYNLRSQNFFGRDRGKVHYIQGGNMVVRSSLKNKIAQSD